jgi:ankyrin repeat protein
MSSIHSQHLYDQNSSGMYFPPSNAVTMVNSDPPYLDFNQNLPNPNLATASSYNIGSTEIENDGKTPLHRATINKSLEEIKSLLFAGAAVNVADHSGNDPLHYAAIAGLLEPIKMLLRFGADVNSRGQLGRSPLHLAILNKPAVEAFLQDGATVSCQDDKGDTPLHLALSVSTFDEGYGNTVIDTLIRAGSNLNIANNAGITPFHKLLDQNYDANRCLRYIIPFLNSGASITHNLPGGRSPFNQFLVKSDRTRQSRPWDTDYILHGEIITTFLQKGADPLTRLPNGENLAIDYFKYTYLNVYQYTSYNLAEQLCNTADVGPIAADGNSILHELCLRCRITSRRRSLRSLKPLDKLIRILLKRGADPNLRNQEGQSPFLLLLTGTHNTVAIVLKATNIMLAYGADSTLPDYEGNIPLYEAAKTLTSEGLEAMLSADAKRRISGTQVNECEPHSWVLAWEQALKAADWTQAKNFLEQGYSCLPQDASKVKSSAFKILAETYVEMTKTMFQGEDLMMEKRRCQVATILRDCRKIEVAIEPKLLDYLLDLC